MEKQYERPLGWTTLEEAKLLVEAGLDPNTADMSYELDTQSPKAVSFAEMEKYYKALYISPLYEPMTKAYPCWSLGALIELMPKVIPHKRNEEEGKEHWSYSLLITRNTIWYGCHVVDNCYYLYDDLVDFKYNNRIAEAAVNAVCWLLKNGYIKK